MIDLKTLSPELQNRYHEISQQYNKFREDAMRFQRSKIHRYVSVPMFFEDMGISATYADMRELADRARKASLTAGVPIRTGNTSIGTLYCYREEILVECFDQMTEGDE